MMENLGIRVKVEPGMFSSERFVTISAGDATYFLFVDVVSLIGENILKVYLVFEEDEDVLVDLPQDTLNNGSRIRIPRDLLTTVPA